MTDAERIKKIKSNLDYWDKDHPVRNAVEFLLSHIEKLEKELEAKTRDLESKEDWDYTPCSVCGTGTMWGSRHPKCGESVMALESQNKDFREGLKMIVNLRDKQVSIQTAVEVAEEYLIKHSEE